MVTSAIGLVFVLAVTRVGVSAWRGGDWRTVRMGEMLTVLFPMMGLFGTVAGLFINREAFAAQGVQSLGLMGTALVSTGTGVLASGLILVLTHVLEMSRESA